MRRITGNQVRTLHGDPNSGPKRLAVRFDGEGTIECIAIVPQVLPRYPINNVDLCRRTRERPLRYPVERGELAGGYKCHGRRFLACVLLFGAMLFGACYGYEVQAEACPLFITASAAGYYNSYVFVGYHSSQYYPAGGAGPYSYENRNFFVFDIPALTQSVVSAELWISGVYNRLDDDSEVYELNEVTNSAQAVLQEGVYQPDVFADLGDGALYGSHVFNRLDRSGVVVIPLNDAFISSLGAASGGQLIIGGRVSTLNDNPNDYEVLFWMTQGTNTVHLALTLGPASGAPQIIQQPIGGSFLDGEELTLRALVCGAEPIS